MDLGWSRRFCRFLAPNGTNRTVGGRGVKEISSWTTANQYIMVHTVLQTVGLPMEAGFCGSPRPSFRQIGGVQPLPLDDRRLLRNTMENDRDPCSSMPML
jgi:hypothetical protein